MASKSQHETLEKSLFDYWNYREYLRDFFDRSKAANRNFSHRYVNAKLGVKSSSFFLQVIQGKSNISPSMRQRFLELLKLSGREAEYFESLVQYNQAETHGDRKTHYERLLNLKPTALRTLLPDQSAYLDKWYHVAVRQALAFQKVKDDFHALARSLVPQISPGQAKRSVLLLEKLGLAGRDPEGYYRWTEPSLTTGEESHAPGAGDFLLQTMELAKGALDLPKTQRHLSAMTLTLSEKSFHAVEEKLMRLRRELYELVERDEEADRVYHLNLHCFPMTKPAKPGKVGGK